MPRPIIACIAAPLVALWAIAGPAPTTGGPGDPPAAPAEDLDALPTDDLIARLQPVGAEWRWDPRLGRSDPDPVSEAFRRRVDAGGLTDAQWRRALLETGAIRLRARWPRAVPYAVSLHRPHWLPLVQIRLIPRGQGLRPASVGLRYWGSCGVPMVRDLSEAAAGRVVGRLPEGTREIVFDVEVERGRSWVQDLDGAPRTAGILWKGEIASPITLVDGFDDVVRPVMGGELDAAVRASLVAGLRTWGGKPGVPFVAVDTPLSRHPALAGVAIDAKVEVLHEGRVVAESTLTTGELDEFASGRARRGAEARLYGQAILRPARPGPPEAWAVRVTGTNAHARWMWDAERRWAGTVTIPWTEAEARGPSGSAPAAR